MFCDIHAHLTEEDYNSDLNLVLARAKKAGVNLIIVVGVDIRDSEKVVQLIKDNEILYGNVGVHPHEADWVKEEELNKIIC
jgi:TatD DNase family protein